MSGFHPARDFALRGFIASKGGSRAPKTSAPPQTNRAESAVRHATRWRRTCRARDGGDVSPA